MTPFTIKKGMNIPFVGDPKSDLLDIPRARVVAAVQEEAGLRVKVLVKEGDLVKRGTPLYIDKKNTDLHFCAPAAGTVRSIDYGPRRALERVVIDVADQDDAESYTSYTPDQLLGISREETLGLLLRSGMLALIRQRPFGHVADPAVTPKSIFVNGMNTGLYQPDLAVAVEGRERYFQSGLNVLARLTTGAVHLCLPPNAPDTLTQVTGVQIHTFAGPHPAGNTSVHIHHIDAMAPQDHVWTVRGVDVLRIGHLFIDGAYPTEKIISLAGPGVKAEARAHYRVHEGTPLSQVLEGRLEEGEQRIVGGDILSGQTRLANGYMRNIDTAITVLPEGREQCFLGWMAPGINKYSASRAYLSGWFGQKRKWVLDTNLHGGYRSMVLTGLYDKYMPMNIMVDFLVRAVLAHDTEEAIQLGILETLPEDFALCSFVCPSKTDISGIIERGLKDIEKEGI